MMTQLQTTWGWIVAFYLFLGGLGAGSFITAAVIYLATGDRYKSTVRFGAWVSAICIAVGTLFLLLDVGQPFRALVLFRSFVNMTSWMAIGAWLLILAIVVNGLFALFRTDWTLGYIGKIWMPLQEKAGTIRKILAIVGIPVSLGVAIYTGVLLGVLPFRPLWNTWLLPALFTASALDTGVGLVAAYAAVREKAEGAKRLGKVLEAAIITLIVVEGAVLGVFLSTMLNGSPDAARSAEMLTTGALWPALWIVVVGLGLVVPLLVCITQLTGLLKKKAALVVPLVGATSCLIGGWTLRFVILSAGLPAMLTSPAMQQMLEGIKYLP
ncbi:MAG: NrfD/PsrC family molybdoenzyme membrane anchor subunit [Anaerolineae bacterium]|jgi:formate-dependent nitrite reductase membrane component NrfD|nr:NrfD/PsrC family molybdoenzyme membrane anchor subunit [Anaerolineae bacterium]